MPGEGQARLREIFAALQQDHYQGALAIEPHIATVFHAKAPKDVDPQQCYDSYVAYGKQLEALLTECGIPSSSAKSCT